jgi:hypothetical protein
MQGIWTNDSFGYHGDFADVPAAKTLDDLERRPPAPPAGSAQVRRVKVSIVLRARS